MQIIVETEKMNIRAEIIFSSGCIFFPERKTIEGLVPRSIKLYVSCGITRIAKYKPAASGPNSLGKIIPISRPMISPKTFVLKTPKISFVKLLSAKIPCFFINFINYDKCCPIFPGKLYKRIQKFH